MLNNDLKYGRIPATPELRKALFSYDDGETIYPGATFGQTWNGWDCPYFTAEVAATIPDIEDCDRQIDAKTGLVPYGAQCLTWEEWTPDYEPAGPIPPAVRAELNYRAHATNTGIVEINAEHLKGLLYGYNPEN